MKGILAPIFQTTRLNHQRLNSGMLRLCTVYNPRTLFAKSHVERIKLRSAIFSMKVGIPTSQPSIDSSLS